MSMLLFQWFLSSTPKFAWLIVFTVGGYCQLQIQLIFIELNHTLHKLEYVENDFLDRYLD